MKRIETFGIISFTLLLFTTFSVRTVNGQTMEREANFISLCSLLKIPLDNTDVIFMPPTSCRSCQKNILEILHLMPNVYVLHDKIDNCEVVASTQKCVGYKRVDVESKGFVKLYSALIKIRNSKVVEYRTLFK